jgi:FeS assembly SUF system protein
MDGQKKFVKLGTSRLPDAAEAKAAPQDESGTLEERIVRTLKTCYDPELPVNIVELGLIYDLTVEPSGTVAIRMTLTSPGCPVADSLVREIRSKVQAVPGVTSAQVELVWDPPWDKSRMSEAARLEAGLM